MNNTPIADYCEGKSTSVRDECSLCYKLKPTYLGTSTIIHVLTAYHGIRTPYFHFLYDDKFCLSKSKSINSHQPGCY